MCVLGTAHESRHEDSSGERVHGTYDVPAGFRPAAAAAAAAAAKCRAAASGSAPSAALC